MDKNGQLHADKIKDVFKIHQSPAVTKQADLEMFVDMCIVKDAGETNPCERAYRFSKCLMTEPEMFGRLEEEVEEEGGTIREMITSFLKDMGSTVLAVLNILNEVREVVAAALSG
ncbi:uncharacterized protein [Periplaneta americana]|uniref:uncharacterized protein n=1 Tax=Periplaneta americana TaxID=6978 RepID=UPI0037E85836